MIDSAYSTVPADEDVDDDEDSWFVMQLVEGAVDADVGTNNVLEVSDWVFAVVVAEVVLSDVLPSRNEVERRASWPMFFLMRLLMRPKERKGFCNIAFAEDFRESVFDLSSLPSKATRFCTSEKSDAFRPKFEGSVCDFSVTTFEVVEETTAVLVGDDDAGVCCPGRAMQLALRWDKETMSKYFFSSSTLSCSVSTNDLAMLSNIVSTETEELPLAAFEAAEKTSSPGSIEKCSGKTLWSTSINGIAKGSSGLFSSLEVGVTLSFFIATKAEKWAASIV